MAEYKNKDSFDVIIIGAGHNGLTLGCYLADAGLSVLICERRLEFGGGLSTEESTLSGFYHNLHSNFHATPPFLPPLFDFQLEKRGIKYIHPDANIGMPLKDGRALVLYNDDFRAAKEIEKFSKKDAKAFLDVRTVLSQNVMDLLNWVYSPPPGRDQEDRLKDIEEKWQRWFGKDIQNKSPYDFVCERFENPHVQALLLFHMAVAGFDVSIKEKIEDVNVGLAALGLGYIGFITNWQLCQGGSHHLAHALGAEFLSHGGMMEEHAHVEQILVQNGEAKGVRLKDGREFYARHAVASSVEPDQTFLKMLDEKELKPDFRDAVSKLKYGGMDVLFGVHLALKEPPRYTSEKFNPDIFKTFNLNIGYESPEDLIEHYDEIRREEVPGKPRLECSINTLFDPTQAPKGYHTALTWQFAPFAPGGNPEKWDELKEAYAWECVESWREYAPNMTKDNVLSLYAYSPLDITRKMVNMRRGGFHTLAVIPSQLLWRRPLEEVGQYRTPVKKLYLCGSSTHAHGGILASPGYNAMQVIAEDLGVLNKVRHGNKFWQMGR